MTPGVPIAVGEPAAGVLTGVLILATSVWTGGLVAIFLVARIAGRTLQPADRVALFRGLGRAYGPVGTLSLAAALGCGAALVHGHAWDAAMIAALVIAVCLVAITGTGMAQARRMTRLRRDAQAHPGDPLLARHVRAGAVRAAALRASIAALTLALIAVSVLIAS